MPHLAQVSLSKIIAGHALVVNDCAKAIVNMPHQPDSTRTKNHVHICMIVTNDMTSDARVARHAATLGLNGYRVTVVCKSSERSKNVEDRDGYTIIRVRSKLGHRSTLLDQRIADPATQGDQEQTRFLAMRSKNLSWAIRFFIRIVAIALLQFAMLREARKTRADILCANDLDTLALAIFAAGLDRKIVYDSHELWPDMLLGVPQFLKRILCSYEKILVKRAHAVMTVNEFIADELTSRYSIRQPVRVVYNCSYPTPVAKGKMQKRSKVKVALYHGWYYPERGLENVAKASEHLLPDVLLLFRGAGPLEKGLKTLVSDRDNVRFEPPVDARRVVEAAAHADVGIVPYLPTNLCNYYASPNKLFEYLDAGLPIAASDLPFMRKLVLKERIGTLFDARDPRSIARALNTITRRNRLNSCRKRVALARRKYNWKVESRKLLDVYADLSSATG